jgi:dienelactone hydrolase
MARITKLGAKRTPWRSRISKRLKVCNGELSVVELISRPEKWEQPMRFKAILAVLLAVCTPAVAQVPYDETALSIPMTDGRGETHQLAGKLCLPQGVSGKTRLVVINHGSPVEAAERRNMELGGCRSEPAQWFLTRGFAVVFALRRGYGATGGVYAEDHGRCNDPDYIHAGLDSARDVEATVNYATMLPQVRADGAIVAGVSAGGWATLAYGAISHPRVIALIDFAGGRGGHHNNNHNSNCMPEALADAAGFYAKTASTPMLWVYAENDTFFPPRIAAALYKSYSDHGGKADFHAMPSFGDEGHHLWGAKGGSTVWGPLVDDYLKQRGVLGADGRASR